VKGVEGRTIFPVVFYVLDLCIVHRNDIIVLVKLTKTRSWSEIGLFWDPLPEM